MGTTPKTPEERKQDYQKEIASLEDRISSLEKSIGRILSLLEDKAEDKADAESDNT